jgi:methionyl-tRNA formyltransferase
VDDVSRSDAVSTSRPLRCGFAGTPAFAARILQALLQSGRVPVVVYTQPDRPSGRGRRTQPSAVKLLAESHDLPVRQPTSLRTLEEAEALTNFGLDVLVVAAYGLLLPPTILRVPRLGCLNVHASLLPRWRGAAPIERAIMAGDSQTGACIMQMDEGLDTGPVYLCRACAITSDTDAPALESRLATLGSEALLTCLGELPELQPTPQPGEGVTYARKLTRSDAEIRWRQPAIDIDRQVRALRGRMPAVTGLGAARMNVLEARALDPTTRVAGGAAPGTIVAASAFGIEVACGTGILNILRLKLNLGKGLPLTAAEALNGFGRQLAVGTLLGAKDPEDSGKDQDTP